MCADTVKFKERVETKLTDSLRESGFTSIHSHHSECGAYILGECVNTEKGSFTLVNINGKKDAEFVGATVESAMAWVNEDWNKKQTAIKNVIEGLAKAFESNEEE